MNAPLITPLALANIPILQALRDGGHASVAGLARAIDRDKSNAGKSVKALESAGLVEWPALTATGLAALEAWERAELGDAEPAVAGVIYHWQIQPDPQNPRRDFDSDEAIAALQELSNSIAADGLLENLVVRPMVDTTTPSPDDDIEHPAYMLIAGERRWRAIGLAIKAGRLPLSWPVPHTIRDVDEVTARRLALVENLQRRDLKPLEEARALQQLVDLDGRTTSDIATDIGFTQRWAQQRLQLLQLSPGMQRQLDAGALKIEGARTVLAIWERLPAIKRVELEEGKITPQAAKEWLDAQPTPLSDAAKLAIMEFYEKLSKAPYKAGYSGKATRIVGTIERNDRGENGVTIKVKVDDPKGAFEELRKANLIDQPGRVTDEGVETGEVYVSTGYNGEYILKQKFPSALEAKFRKNSIPTLRVQVYGLQVDYQANAGGGYATPWLETPPFTLAPDVAAEIEKKRAARFEREQKAEQDRAADQARREEAERQRQARLAASADLEPELRQALAANAGRFAGMLSGKSEELGWKLPLFLDTDGQVIDADGREVIERSYSWERDKRLTFLRFLVGAVNVAAGLETPASRPVPMDPDAIPREDFLARVVAALVEDAGEDGAPTPFSAEAAEELAPRALDNMLGEEGWVYGQADAWDWDVAGAASFAAAIQRGEYLTDDDRQVDLEEAIEAKADEEDVEVTPALARLAGVEPREAAE